MDEALLRSDLFGGLDPTAAEALAAALDRVDLPRGAVVFGEGEQGDRLFVLRSGVVTVGRRAIDGREILLSVIGPSDVFGELAAFDPGPRTSTATCVTDVHVYSLGGAALTRWITRSPEFADHRLRLLVRRLRRAESRLTEMAVSEVASRVAAVLLHLAHRFGYQEAGRLRIRAVLSHDEIAELAGASHEVGRKALEDFVARGWLLVDKKSLVVLEPDRLRRHSRRAVSGDLQVGSSVGHDDRHRAAPRARDVQGAEGRADRRFHVGVDPVSADHD
ncbi:Crp/Fnr family transcriptional regulator [Actinomycetospora soli]|uniref:Crp/Fnr family transcriptional regulator n=1 Tax=Actinomycetospora soli TaxID=2893887 RepID=UPI0021061606